LSNFRYFGAEFELSVHHFSKNSSFHSNPNKLLENPQYDSLIEATPKVFPTILF
jgi:hypothetical protein